ncbi:unnamed protein product [Parajaminaea phylloscopi]
MSAVPPACAAVAAQVQEATTQAIVRELNTEALPIVCLIWLSLGFWFGDWSNAWDEERELLRRGFTPAGFSYFLARFGGGLTLLCYGLSTLVGGTGTSLYSCHRVDKVLAVFYCLTSIGAQGAFMLRCAAVWENRPSIRILFMIFMAIIVGSFVLFAVLIDGMKTSIGIIICDITEPSRLEIVATLSTMLIDAICIGLTAYKLRNKLQRGRVHQLLFRDGVIYLFIVVAVSGGLTGMILSDLPHIQRVILSPVHVAALSIAATRAQRALKAEGAKMASKHSISGSPLPSANQSFPPKYPRQVRLEGGGEHILGDIPEHGSQHPWAHETSPHQVPMQRFGDSAAVDGPGHRSDWSTSSPGSPMSPGFQEKAGSRFA